MNKIVIGSKLTLKGNEYEVTGIKKTSFVMERDGVTYQATQKRIDKGQPPVKVGNGTRKTKKTAAPKATTKKTFDAKIREFMTEENIRFMENLRARWEDEKKYEDWSDYEAKLKTLSEDAVSATKRPFGLKIKIDGVEVHFVLKVTRTQVGMSARFTERPVDGNLPYMNARLKFEYVFDKKTKLPETDDECMNWFVTLAGELSPENLSCDGECSNAQINKKYRALKAEWKECESIIGRKVTEDEVWNFCMKKRS